MKSFLKCIIVFVVFFGFASSVWAAEAGILVYLMEVGDLAYMEDGTAKGKWVDETTALLDQTGLSYTIVVASWQRAINSVNRQDNIIIGPLDRIETREDQFQWVWPLETLELKLYTHNREPFRQYNLDEAIASGGQSVCVVLTSRCQMLSTLGFPEAQIWTISADRSADLSHLLSRGRVDFRIADPAQIAADARAGEHGADEFIAIHDVMKLTSYLAASKDFNPIYMERIRTAAEALR